MGAIGGVRHGLRRLLARDTHDAAATHPNDVLDRRHERLPVTAGWSGGVQLRDHRIELLYSAPTSLDKYLDYFWMPGELVA